MTASLAGRSSPRGWLRCSGRIAAACEASGTEAEDVTLIAVTKTFPASDVRLLRGLGVRDVGENRDAEAAPKAAQCADLDLIWHFIGQLQTNKAASVARYASFVHSVDRPRLIRALGTGARRAGRVIECLIEVSLDGDPARGGALAGRRSRPGRGLDGRGGLVLAGVMAVAPLGMPPCGLRQAARQRGRGARHPARRDRHFGRHER